MRKRGFFSLSVLPGLLAAGSVQAIELPPPGTGDPLGLSVCHVVQDDDCGLLDLKGYVKRVVVMAQSDESRPAREYRINRAGRVVEVRVYFLDVLGGMSSKKFVYDEEGRVIHVVLGGIMGRAVEQYDYIGNYLSRVSGRGEPVTYEVQELGEGQVRVTAGTSKGTTTFSLDAKGRLLYADENIGRVIQLGGLESRTHCAIEEKDAGALEVNCTHAGGEVRRTIDSTGRLIADGPYQFKFEEDSQGNWVVRETKPFDPSRRRVRIIEYY